MTKLPQPPKMGVGVHEVVEMYATSLCDTEPVAKKESNVASSSYGHDFKRRLSEVTRGSSPRPHTPAADLPRTKKRGKRFNSCPSPSSTPSSTPSSSPCASPSPSPSPSLCSSPSSPSLSPCPSPPPSPSQQPPAMTQDTDTDEACKRSRLEGQTASDSDGDSRSKESYTSRRKRFLRTAEALRQSGLLDITMKTAELLRKNHELQREIEDLQRQTKNFVLSVLSNPENRHILENIGSGAQLYEMLVPGSQGIMSVSMQQRDVNTNVTSGNQTVIETEDSLGLSTSAPTETETETNPSSTTLEADSGFSNPSLPSNYYYSPSPSSSTSSFSNDTSSLSDDLDSSEEENLPLPKIQASDGGKTNH